MAGSEATPKAQRSKNKKRKQRSLGALPRPSKTQRINLSEKETEPQDMMEVKGAEKHELREPSHDLEEAGPWRNLELVLSIQNKEIDLQKKVELAYGLVISSVKEEGGKSDQDNQAVNMSRLIIFVNDWIQSLLISSGKKIQSVGVKHQAEVNDTNLDIRCWEIFKFCLEESLKLNVSLNFSRNLVRSIDLIARNALSLLNKTSSRPTLSFSSEELQLYNTVLDCISLVFASHGGMSDENLDLWVSTVGAVLDLLHKFYVENLVCGNGGDFVFRFLCLVLEPFAKFLRAHPAWKNGFRDFIDKLLEPLLHLLGLLHLQIDESNPGWTRSLLKLVEEVLSHGLYHPIHIDGFLSLCSSEKYATSNSGKSQDSKTTLKSYHRHLFSSKHDIVNGTRVETLTLITNEVLSAVGYLLEIEYEVIEKDLVSMWLLMLSHLAVGLSLMDAPDQCSLSFKITDIGCQFVVLYSQLRQVNNTIFALCKAIRLLSSHNGDGERNYTRFVISLHGEAHAKSVEMLLCSQEFKIAIQQAVKSIPEGQASGCIGRLTMDVSECLEWMKISCSKSDETEVGRQDVQSSVQGFNLEAELLGRVLSEIYALVLDSLFATTGNCNLLGVSKRTL
ncbi:hypothetical protein ACFX2I_003481 [Malus domestica]